MKKWKKHQKKNKEFFFWKMTETNTWKNGKMKKGKKGKKKKEKKKRSKKRKKKRKVKNEEKLGKFKNAKSPNISQVFGFTRQILDDFQGLPLLL